VGRVYPSPLGSCTHVDRSPLLYTMLACQYAMTNQSGLVT